MIGWLAYVVDIRLRSILKSLLAPAEELGLREIFEQLLPAQPLGLLLSEASADQAARFFSDCALRGESEWLVVQFMDQLHDVGRVPRSELENHLVEDQTQGPDVGFARVGLTLEDLGSHIERGSHKGAHSGVHMDLLCEAEVSDFKNTIVEEDVGRLDVPVDDSPGEQFLDSYQDLLKYFESLFFIQLITFKMFSEISPIAILGHNVEIVYAVKNINQPYNVRVVKGFHNFDFLPNLLRSVVIMNCLVVYDFDGHDLIWDRKNSSLVLTSRPWQTVAQAPQPKIASQENSKFFTLFLDFTLSLSIQFILFSKMDVRISQQLLKLIPKLDARRHKGQNGKIAVIGGSFEYTGAPYYAAVSALKGGGDLAYIICQQSAAIPIKSYSPECIVYPLLTDADESQAPDVGALQQRHQKVAKQIELMSATLMGPGLGRYPSYFHLLTQICAQFQRPKVIDADGLWYLAQSQNPGLLQTVLAQPSQYILTPNAMEMRRLMECFDFAQYDSHYPELNKDKQGFCLIEKHEGYVKSIMGLSSKMNNILIVAKGMYDIITDGKVAYAVYEPSSKKRCGGQGDILSGLVALYAAWATQQEINLIQGCILASLVTRRSAYLACQKHGYSLTTPQILENIGQAFQEVVQNLEMQG